jgi:hypothetical protein
VAKFKVRNRNLPKRNDGSHENSRLDCLWTEGFNTGSPEYEAEALITHVRRSVNYWYTHRLVIVYTHVANSMGLSPS